MSSSISTKKKSFQFGRIVGTPGALETFTPEEQATALKRHLTCDWGDLDDEDMATNDQALENGSRLLSAYEFRGKKLWIITEASDERGKRSVTTLLLPSEY